MANEFEDGLKDLVSEQFKDGEASPLRNEKTGEFIKTGDNGNGDDDEEVDKDRREEDGEEAENDSEEAENDSEEAENDSEKPEGDDLGEDEEPVEGKKLSQAAKLTRALRETRKEIADMKRERAAERAAAAVVAAAPKKADGTTYKDADEYARDKLATDEKAPKKPDPTKFKLGEFDPDFSDAKDDYLDERRRYLDKMRGEFDNASKSASDAAPAQAAQEFTTKLNTTVESGKKLFKDFDEKVVKGIEKDAWALSETGAHFLVDSELGAEMAYHLAGNPKLAKEIAELPPMRQAVRLGKLEEQISAEKAAKAKKAKQGSNAPEPLRNRAKGGGARETGRYDSENFEDVEKNWNSNNKKRG